MWYPIYFINITATNFKTIYKPRINELFKSRENPVKKKKTMKFNGQKLGITKSNFFLHSIIYDFTKISYIYATDS